ncbi:MAG: tetratricopeptide repeat protein [Gammaproteobacteria bacterium]
MNRNDFATLLASVLLAIALSACTQDTNGGPAPTEPPIADEVEIADGLVEHLAEGSDPRTLYIVGNQYAVGDGVEKDQDIAERLWLVACDKGHAYACNNYGSRQIGYGNFDEAARTLTLAAQTGVIDAVRNLIELHDNSQWTGASIDESVKWFEVLQALENPEPQQSTSGDQPQG